MNLSIFFAKIVKYLPEPKGDKDKQLKLVNYIIENSDKISNTMDNSIRYLIDMSVIIDENLPDGFDINELLDKTKYQE